MNKHTDSKNIIHTLDSQMFIDEYAAVFLERPAALFEEAGGGRDAYGHEDEVAWDCWAVGNHY